MWQIGGSKAHRLQTYRNEWLFKRLMLEYSEAVQSERKEQKKEIKCVKSLSSWMVKHTRIEIPSKQSQCVCVCVFEIKTFVATTVTLDWRWSPRVGFQIKRDKSLLLISCWWLLFFRISFSFWQKNHAHCKSTYVSHLSILYQILLWQIDTHAHTNDHHLNYVEVNAFLLKFIIFNWLNSNVGASVECRYRSHSKSHKWNNFTGKYCDNIPYF